MLSWTVNKYVQFVNNIYKLNILVYHLTQYTGTPATYVYCSYTTYVCCVRTVDVRLRVIKEFVYETFIDHVIELLRKSFLCYFPLSNN